ncbi:BCCT transporter [Candidatus Formimonas warabiya]|uniref:BCCT transporter n=2 Tax=Formimonas warabiya TaxID=1761012 RepID=A0A3G1KMU5_FORW1|nr:BCCT transporter [Candidatus Formimonas warabiya]
MKNLRPIAFWPPVILFVAAVILNLVNKDAFSAMINGANSWLMGNFAWAFDLGVLVMLAVIIYVMFSRFGDVRIGGSKAVPLFDSVRFFSITLTTIIAIGILFWATSEPMYHLTAPPESLGIEPNSPQAAIFAMSTLFLHWTFSPLAIYAIVTVTFAFAYYNMKKPFSLGSALYPVFGEKAIGAWGQGIDAVCAYALVAGMAASLGTAVLAISGGINYLTGVQTGAFLWLVVDIAVIATFVISSITGLFNGIKKLSEINTIIFIGLTVFVFIFGPAAYMLNLGTEAFGDFMRNFFTKSLFTGAAANDPWGGWWTIFYWCNWLAWSPVTGMFLGRISYGHTIRKTLVVTFLLPAVFTIFWMMVFGGAAINLQLAGAGIADAMANGPEFAVYAFLAKYPIAVLTIPIFIFTMFLSYVTGADANTTALGGLSTTGISPESPEPSMLIKVFWGAILGAVAWIMISTAGVDGIKMLSNLGGGPALILELIMTVSLLKMAANPKKYDVFKDDYMADGTPIKSEALPALTSKKHASENTAAEV